MRISQPSELRTAGWACATARAVEAPQRPPTSAGDHRPGFVGLAAPRRPPPPAGSGRNVSEEEAQCGLECFCESVC